MRSSATRLLLALAGAALAFAAVELGLRSLLFGRASWSRELGANLRRAELFAEPDEDLYWSLNYRFQPQQDSVPRPPFDPVLGWHSRLLESDTYAHLGTSRLDERRPVLHYGDSFARCLTESNECFEGLLGDSELADTHWLLNYGGGGYGLDQIYLMVRESIDAWVEQDPLVIVSVYYGDDLERCSLSFREWPKPRISLDGAALVVDPPAESESHRWVQEYSPRVTSYLWRWILHNESFPARGLRERLRGRERRLAELRELCPEIVEETCRLLAERELDFFFLLFPGAVELDRAPGWQEQLLVQSLGALDIPFVNARDDFEAELRTGRRPRSAYFESGHYTAEGNEVAFRAMLRGIGAVRSRAPASTTEAATGD